MRKKKPPKELLAGVMAFPLDKEIFITEGSGNIHRHAGVNRVHLPVGTLIVIDAPEDHKWSGIQIGHNQFYRFTSKNTIRLHRHYRVDTLEITELDDLYAYPPTSDKNAQNNNLIRKFADFLAWMGSNEIKKYNAHHKAKAEEGTSPLPELSDLKESIKEENLIEEEPMTGASIEEICSWCAGIGTIFDETTGTYENCEECNPSKSTDDEGEEEDDCPF